MSTTTPKKNSPFATPTMKAIKLGAPFEFASQFTSKWQIKTLEFLLPYVRTNLPIELVCKISLKIQNYMHYKALSLGTPLEYILDFKTDPQIDSLIFLVETAKINISIEIAVEIALAITTELHKNALIEGVPVHYIKEFSSEFQLQAYNHIVNNNPSALPVDKIVEYSLKIQTSTQLEALQLSVPAQFSDKFTHKSQIAVFLYFQQHHEPSKPIDEIVKIVLEYTTDLQYQALIYSSDIKCSKNFTHPNQIKALKLGVEANQALKFLEEFQIEALTVLMRNFNLSIADAHVTNLALYFENEDQLDAYEAGVPFFISLEFKHVHQVMALEYLARISGLSTPTNEIIQIALNIHSFEQARALQLGIPLKDTELFTKDTQIYAYTYMTKHNNSNQTQQDIILKALQVINPGVYLAIKSGLPFPVALNFVTECQVDVYIKLTKFLNEDAKLGVNLWQWLFPQNIDPMNIALKFTSELKCQMVENCHSNTDIVHLSQLDIAGEVHTT